MKGEVIIACDFASGKECMDFLQAFKEEKPYLKIGMELFYQVGADFVKELKKQGFSIFLDLKLHDIPNTVYKTMKGLAKIGVDMTNLHAAGGIKMMSEAKRGLLEGSINGKTPLLIAVTQLTSTDQNTLTKEILIDKPILDVVTQYAKNAKIAGLDGVVCSPLEASAVKALDLISVTPGIRLADDSMDDQKRVATPALAKENGSTFIVVGRSITGASNPLSAYRECVKQFN